MHDISTRIAARRHARAGRLFAWSLTTFLLAPALPGSLGSLATPGLTSGVAHAQPWAQRGAGGQGGPGGQGQGPQGGPGAAGGPGGRGPGGAPAGPMAGPRVPAPLRPAPPERPLPAPLRQARGRLFPPLDLGLLEGPDRETWQKPDQIMDVLGIADGAVVADLGAGGGWFTLRLARRVGPNGLVYAQDIQEEMIDVIRRRVERESLRNVRTVLGTATDPKLPAGLDAILVVNSFHEMDDPSRPEVIQTLLRNLAGALKPQGRLGVVDFMPGNGGPGPAADERVAPEIVTRTAASAGLTLQRRETIAPYLYMLVFGRDQAAASRPSF